MPRPVISVSRLSKAYGSTVAVSDVSLEVNRGEIFGLIGPNGAGKTTTMECVQGLRKADRGIRVDDHGDTYRTMYTTALEGVVYVLDVFKKKSKVGVATPRKDLDRIRERLKKAREHFRTLE